MPADRQDESRIPGMTHSLYRPCGDVGEDWVVIARAARGINDTGATDRLGRFLKAARTSGAVNWGHGRGGAHLNRDWENILARLADLATVTVVFDRSDLLDKFLGSLHAMDLGLSITVSGDMARIAEICVAHGWTPHSGRQALGVWGGRDKLPAGDVLGVTAQCGHGLVATRLVEQMVERIRAGELDPEEAALLLGKPCVCGLINPSHTVALLSRLVGSSG